MEKSFIKKTKRILKGGFEPPSSDSAPMTFPLNQERMLTSKYFLVFLDKK
jgi:hypothetical protein